MPWRWRKPTDIGGIRAAMGSQFCSEWWQLGAPFRTKLRTHMLLIYLYNFCAEYVAIAHPAVMSQERLFPSVDVQITLHGTADGSTPLTSPGFDALCHDRV